MKTDVWMPLYVKDYIADTRRLSTLQHGIYLLLIMEYWQTRKPLPDDNAILARLAQLSEEEWQSHRQCLCQFFDIRDGVWRHARIEEELEKAARNREWRSEAGKKGAKGRWNGKANGNANGNAIAVEVAEPCTAPAPAPIDSLSKGEEAKFHVEPHKDFPRTVEAAVAHADFAGCPSEFAETVWHKAVSRGGRDARDIEIRSWRAYLRTEWTYEQQRIALRATNERGQSKHSGGPGVDRNAGTLNAGKADQYAGVGKVV